MRFQTLGKYGIPTTDSYPAAHGQKAAKRTRPATTRAAPSSSRAALRGPSRLPATSKLPGNISFGPARFASTAPSTGIPMAKPAAITGAPLHEHVELLATVLSKHNANVMKYVLSPLIELLNQLKSQISTESTTASSTGIRKIRDKVIQRLRQMDVSSSVEVEAVVEDIRRYRPSQRSRVGGSAPPFGTVECPNINSCYSHRRRRTTG